MDTLGLITTFKYGALFLLSIVEGPVTMAATGFLYKLGHLLFFPAYIALLLGDLTGDIGWYAIGYHGGHHFIKRFGKYFSLTETSCKNLLVTFNKHEGKILFLSKLTMGFGFAVGTLFVAGMGKISLKKFIVTNLLGGLIWTAFLMFLGYSFGNIYLQISEGLRTITIIGSILVLLLALRGIRGYLKDRVAHRKL